VVEGLDDVLLVFLDLLHVVFRHRFLPWNREDVRRFTSWPQTSHVTFSIPQERQILPTPMTIGKVPGVDSSLPHMAHFIVLPVECCMTCSVETTIA